MLFRNHNYITFIPVKHFGWFNWFFSSIICIEIHLFLSSPNWFWGLNSKVDNIIVHHATIHSCYFLKIWLNLSSSVVTMSFCNRFWACTVIQCLLWGSSYRSLQRQKHTVSLKEGGRGGWSACMQKKRKLMTSATCNHWLN
jgi:hypothetical protein